VDPEDGHPGPAGHEFLARLLYEKITRSEELAALFGQEPVSSGGRSTE
jgi:hypothetical protein